jgi:hypothetical protein
MKRKQVKKQAATEAAAAAAATATRNPEPAEQSVVTLPVTAGTVSVPAPAEKSTEVVNPWTVLNQSIRAARVARETLKSAILKNCETFKQVAESFSAFCYAVSPKQTKKTPLEKIAIALVSNIDEKLRVNPEFNREKTTLAVVKTATSKEGVLTTTKAGKIRLNLSRFLSELRAAVDTDYAAKRRAEKRAKLALSGVVEMFDSLSESRQGDFQKEITNLIEKYAK